MQNELSFRWREIVISRPDPCNIGINEVLFGTLDPIFFTNILLSFVYVIMQIILVIFLIKRTIKARISNLYYIDGVFAAAAIAALLGGFRSNLVVVFQPWVSIFILPFVKNVFYSNKKSPYKPLLFITMCLYAALLITKIARELAGETDALFLVNNILTLGIYIIPYIWLANSAYKARINLKRIGKIKPWLNRRYILLAWTAMIAVLPAFFPLLYHSHDTWREEGFLPRAVMAALSILFSIMSYFTWFVSQKTKAIGTLVDTNYNNVKKTTEDISISNHVTHQQGKVEYMSIIDYIGEILAKYVNKNPSAAKGLVFMAIQKELGKSYTQTLTLSNIKRVFNKRVCPALEELGVPDAYHVNKQVLEDIEKNQSILFMLSV